MEQKFYKQCQSCGMPLENGLKSGTEADGSKSLKYCDLCYKDGAFIEPNATVETMKERIDGAFKDKGIGGKIMGWMGKMQLPSLERWTKAN